MSGNPAPPDTPETVHSPNNRLASEITEALVAAGLIKDTHKKTLLAKLKIGGVRQEDWSLWIDMATSPQVTQAEANNG